MIEEWKAVPGYEGMYEVSNLGRVRSLPRTIGRSNGVRYRAKAKTLSPTFSGKGYLKCILSNRGISRNLYVHRLVAQAFLWNAEAKPEVNHINGDKTDNSVSNLEWCTSEENRKHADEIGISRTKFSEEIKREIRAKRKEGLTYRKISEIFKISTTHVGRIVCP